MFTTAFATVFGTVFGIIVGIIVVVFRDKRVVIKLGKIIAEKFAKEIMNSPALVQMLMPVITFALGATKNINSTTATGTTSEEATVNGNIMTIPFTFRRSNWKLMIQYDQSKSDTDVKWIADKVDVTHCPMLPFLLTKEELGVNELVVKEEEEIDI
jgi:hypothetical protein